MNNKFRTIANKANKHAYKYSGILVCTSCGKVTYLDESYSDHGANLICIDCVTRWSNRLNITPARFGELYVWEEGE